MKEKRFTPLVICHLCMLVIMTLFSIASAILMFSGSADMDYENHKAMIYAFGCFEILDVLTLLSGILYLLKGYKKAAALYYKAFMLLNAFSAIGAAVGLFFYREVEEESYLPIVIIQIVASAVEAVILLAMTFWKDLGKTNTWILFSVILTMDIITGALFTVDRNTFFYRLVTVISVLFVDGTLGLIIRGKYIDKEARGSK